MRFNNKHGFTLVELIVVVTILSVLATIGFVSYSSYLSGVRDTNRISQLKAIGDSLHLYTTKSSLPIPDDKINITTNGTNVIGYQGYVGESVVDTIGYTSEGKDPKDGSYFSYYLTKDRKYFQLLGYLEEELDFGITLNKDILRFTRAEDYEFRYPYVEGGELGILTTETNQPIQETESVVNLSSLPSGTISILSNGDTQSGTDLTRINPDFSCKRIYEVKNKRKSGVYSIDPLGDGVGFDVYCDMETEGGGWTLVHKTTSSPNNLVGVLTETEGNPDWLNNKEYRLSISFWKNLSTQKAMAKNIRIDGLSWNDISEGKITYIGTDKVDFTGDDQYFIFGAGTGGNGQSKCSGGTNYWNGSCCSRCVNYDKVSTYGVPKYSPMIKTSITSTTESAIEGAGGTSDADWHRLSKMGIFLK